MVPIVAQHSVRRRDGSYSGLCTFAYGNISAGYLADAPQAMGARAPVSAGLKTDDRIPSAICFTCRERLLAACCSSDRVARCDEAEVKPQVPCFISAGPSRISDLLRKRLATVQSPASATGPWRAAHGHALRRLTP